MIPHLHEVYKVTVVVTDLGKLCFYDLNRDCFVFEEVFFI